MFKFWHFSGLRNLIRVLHRLDYQPLFGNGHSDEVGGPDMGERRKLRLSSTLQLKTSYFGIDLHYCQNIIVRLLSTYFRHPPFSWKLCCSKALCPCVSSKVWSSTKLDKELMVKTLTAEVFGWVINREYIQGEEGGLRGSIKKIMLQISRLNQHPTLQKLRCCI